MDFYNFGLGTGFLDITSKAQATGTTKKIVWTSKDTIKKMERHPQNGRKWNIIWQ